MKDIGYQSPNWWPKTESKKYKWKNLYRKIKPLYDAEKTYSYIARELNIDRHDVSRILIWFDKSREAHGK